MKSKKKHFKYMVWDCCNSCCIKEYVRFNSAYKKARREMLERKLDGGIIVQPL